MIKGVESILLNTESAKKLADFYVNVVGLKKGMEFVNDETGEEVIEIKLDNISLYVNDHSKIKGESKDPDRIMFNLEVDDIEKEVERMKQAKAKVVKDAYHVEGYGLIATFSDVDGNLFQFVQIRESK